MYHDQSMMPPMGPGGPDMGMPPEMGAVPPGPDMAMPPADAGMPPEMGPVPPGPDELLGSEPADAPVTVPGWIPADPDIPVDDMTCAEIDAIPYADKSGKPFCLVRPPGEAIMPPGGGPPIMP